MGKAKAAPAEGTFSFRLLIMLFALGIVVIGIYPIRKQLRRSVEGVRRFVEAHLPNLPDDESNGPATDDVSRFTLTDRPKGGADSEPPIRRPEKVTVDRSMKKREQLDHISADERKQLSDLVNSF